MELVSLLILVLVAVATFVASKFTHSGNPYPFTQKKALFTQVESAFLSLLEKAVGNDFKIVSRVKLVDILDFQPGIDSKSRRSALAKAQAKQLDYVLLDKTSLKIVGGIPLIRIKVKAGYKPQEVRQAILFKLGKPVDTRKPIRKSTIKNTPALSPSQIKSQSTALAQV